MSVGLESTLSRGERLFCKSYNVLVVGSVCGVGGGERTASYRGVTVAYGVRHGMGVVPSPTAYKWLSYSRGPPRGCAVNQS